MSQKRTQGLLFGLCNGGARAVEPFAADAHDAAYGLPIVGQCHRDGTFDFMPAHHSNPCEMLSTMAAVSSSISFHSSDLKG